MKTESYVCMPRLGWTKAFIWCVVIVLLGSLDQIRAATSDLLEKGIYTEETKGDLSAATAIYQQIVDDPSANSSLKAQAHLRLGLCQLKLGNKPQAITALERLTQEFPDQKKLLAIVEQHMPQVLDDIVGQIERHYLMEVDRGELIETALRAIMGKLDGPGRLLRTDDMEFFGTNELSRVNEQLDQQIAGIGAELKFEDGEILVRSPLPGSPAFDAGLQAGDRIITINGIDLPQTKTLETAVKLLRGPVGTAVRVGVRRGDAETLQQIKLVRNTIRLPSILGDRRQQDSTWDFMLDEQKLIGYIRITYIGKQSAAELQSALEELTARGMKALVLDLRNNPGGMLEGAVAISDLFIDSGRILTVKGRNGETIHEAKMEGTLPNFPVALLINRITASAAEIVAACLQDHQRAVVIGERTAGQGIVRSLVPLQSGGALKLPIAIYLRPSGKSVNRFPNSQDSDDWGVNPDAGYEVVLTDEELKGYQKERADRDVLNPAGTLPAQFHDRALETALEWIAGRTVTP